MYKLRNAVLAHNVVLHCSLRVACTAIRIATKPLEQTLSPSQIPPPPFPLLRGRIRIRIPPRNSIILPTQVKASTRNPPQRQSHLHHATKSPQRRWSFVARRRRDETKLGRERKERYALRSATRILHRGLTDAWAGSLARWLDGWCGGWWTGR